MTFDSVQFLVFLPIVFAVYWVIPRTRWQNAFLLAASAVFYGAWNWRYLGLILGTNAFVWLATLQISRIEVPPEDDPRARSTRLLRRLWLALALFVDLGALAFFKYLNWGITSFTELLAVFGVHSSAHTLELVLPVGISFHTFQALSYAIDVYKGRIRPTKDPLAFLAFVAFFPQLVAGPIERSTHFLPQFLRARHFDARAATDGVMQMLYGLVLKVVLADNLADLVNAAYHDPTTQGPWALLVATWAFAFQIYGDFAGYSHVAIGCARLFGFELSRNFAHPYFSVGASEFWRRWHISLSTWFRDYVYVPLGGNRAGWARQKLNVVITFVLSGIWHGANWTFVAWGLYWGVLVALDPTKKRVDLRNAMGTGFVPTPGDALRAFLTFQIASLGWVLFRAPSIGVAWQIAKRFPEVFVTHLPPDTFAGFWPLVPVVVVWEWATRHEQHGFALRSVPAPARVVLALGACLVIALWGQVRTVPFIYFQF